MNRAIRRVGIAIVALVLVLVAQLTYLTIVDANNLKHDPHNVRALLAAANRPRGPIVTADGTVVAQSRKVSDSTVFKYLREYPTKDLFSHAVGYQSFVFGSTGVERAYNNALLGRENQLNLNNIPDIFSGKQTTGTVVLSMRADAQRAAQAALGFQRGSVVLLDVKTGGILAMYSNPSFDPNPFVVHDAKLSQAAFTSVQQNPDHPALPRAYRERYPPGSSFKTVTAAVALEDGVATPDTTFPFRTALPLPQASNTLKNFGGENCGGTLVASFTVSCNTTFGQLGLQLGDQFVPGMAKFGIGTAPPPIDVNPGAVRSTGPPAGGFRSNQPLYALAAIGQNAVAVTPLEMALVADGIANGGVIMQPHVVSEVRDANDKVIRRIDPTPWMTATTPQVAQAVTQMMIQVVKSGTGTAAQIPGVTVAGKTGTAQTGANQAPHAWFVAFAPAEAPRFAVAVIVEHGGNAGNDATGGRVAAPIAARMLQLALGVK